MSDRPASRDANFAELTERFLVAHYEANPDRARQAGLHLYDARLPDLGRMGRARRGEELEAFRLELDAIDPDGLGDLERVEHAVMVGVVAGELFRDGELRVWNRDPISWLDRIEISDYLTRDYAPLGDRCAALAMQLKATPRFLDDARDALDERLDRIVVKNAIELFEGYGSFLDGELRDVFEGAHGGDRAFRRDMLQARAQASEGVRDFVDFLREREEGAGDCFAIGEEAFRNMLATGEGIDITPERLLEIGERDLERNRRAIREVARGIDPGATPAELVRGISGEHPSGDELAAVTRAGLDELRRFIESRGIATIPSDTECLVRETPSYLAFAFAMMDGPGALGDTEHAGIYYVTPPQPGWEAGRAEDWLREFCRPELTLTSMHEAWPGHFLHALHVRRNPSRVIRTFETYSSAEAWAHYSEEMMIAEGFGDGDPALRLFQLKGALVRNIRLVASIRMHTQKMTVDEATRMFIEEGHLAEGAARAEAERGTFDPGYCNYTLGKLMLRKLRDDVRSERGAAFSIRSFHDEFLSWGEIPVPLVRECLLGDGSGPAL